MITLTPQQTKWIEALESGNFQQGRAALNKQGAFCCLGIACEIFKDELGLSYRETDSLGFYDDCSGFPPERVAEHLGLYNRYGGNCAKNQPSLAERNDQGATFKEIAEILKEGSYFR